MTDTLTPPPKEKPWIWTSLGTAAMIVLCCGIAPVVAIAGIEAVRDSPSNSGKGSAVIAKASHHPSPRGTSPAPAPPAPGPSKPPSPNPSPTPVPFYPPLVAEPPAEQAHPQAPPEAPPAEDPPSQVIAEAPPEIPPPHEEVPAPPPQEVTLPQPTQPEQPSGAARIGDTVRSDGLEFVVREVNCGLKQVGTGTAERQAQGQFCLVKISVRNVGELAQTLTESAQTAVGTNGSRYSANADASLAANENQNFLNGIDPGEEVSGYLVFELPDGVNLTEVLLPGGITVSAS